MAESKYGKNIITELKSEDIIIPSSRRVPSDIPGNFLRHILWLDNNIVKGAFFVECEWNWPRPNATDVTPPRLHSHPFDEVIAMFGTNPEDPHDLGGETEVVLDGEHHIINKSCLVFIPKGMEHGAGSIRVNRPIICVNIGATTTYL
jgi:hypothetical protein